MKRATKQILDGDGIGPPSLHIQRGGLLVGSKISFLTKYIPMYAIVSQYHLHSKIYSDLEEEE